ncbi:ERI1 exoribonuclease 2 [Cichlidogyrus casuarinus]|uniref:ERI1 exoribonuclease 2 n=1 Tax=Cichlidogyrus casuarinus TaxID=1844966 RepID=A0ABD2Q4C0_9PLAT
MNSIMDQILRLANRDKVVDIINNENLPGGTAQKEYNYLIVIDFESTCSVKTGEYCPTEIIEFPAIIVDLKENKTLEIFHHYVRPTEQPILTDFCMNLTGISQKIVDQAKSIELVLKLYDIWIKELQTKYGIEFREDAQVSVAHASWTDWDVRTCLYNECTRKKIPIPKYLLHRIDLKEIFKAWLETDHPLRLGIPKRMRWHGKLFDALTILKLGFIGRQHSGIDDTKNTCRLLLKMRSVL